jgi:predicted  nucleic acid-binding Zn-ribbon protein
MRTPDETMSQRLQKRIRELLSREKAQREQIIQLHIKIKELEGRMTDLEELNSLQKKELSKLKRKPSDTIPDIN